MNQKIVWLIAACFTLIGFMWEPVQAEDAKAREIMQKVEDRDDGDDMTSKMEMILIDKRGNQRIRQIATFMKDKGEDTYRLMFFLHPPDVKDTGFLTYDYDDAETDDDQWLYLPALRKTKRIATDDKSQSFMGSDLNYSDMTGKELEEYDFFLKKEMEVNGHKTWLIEAIPRSRETIEETGYEKGMVFVRQDNYVVVRSVQWIKEGGKLRYLDVKKLENIDGIWIPTETHVATKLGKNTVHATILKQTDIKFNQDLDYDMFTVRRLEKGF